MDFFSSKACCHKTSKVLLPALRAEGLRYVTYTVILPFVMARSVNRVQVSSRVKGCLGEVLQMQGCTGIGQKM